MAEIVKHSNIARKYNLQSLIIPGAMHLCALYYAEGTKNTEGTFLSANQHGLSFPAA